MYVDVLYPGSWCVHGCVISTVGATCVCGFLISKYCVHGRVISWCCVCVLYVGVSASMGVLYPGAKCAKGWVRLKC